MKKKLAVVAVISAALLGLSACSSDSPAASMDMSTGSSMDAATVTALGGEESVAYLDDLYKQAVAAGQNTINVYGVTATSSASLYTAFSARYPEITVNHVTVFGAELQSRIASEQATKQYIADNVSVSGADAIYVSSKGYLADQSIPLASSLAAVNKPAGEQLYGGNEYLYTLAYNSDQVADADAPTSFADLLDPKYKGKIGMYDPMVGNTGFVSAAIAAGKIDETWLTKFRANDPVIFPSERDLFTAVSTGQVSMGLGDYIRGDAFLKTDSLPVKFVAKWKDGVSSGTFYRGTVKDAPNALASNLLVAWWLTPEAQELIAEQGQPGLMPDAPAVPGQPALSEITVNPEPTFAEYGTFTDSMNALFKKAFS
ncbi:ABC transporter substrate-binding protein [Subtercola frigoramans]|uniref:Iron(III) transport system substrate-binding protein n=1 Tax=Subtercola frigoramans TaxID=120298 RepID=A0ABS2L8P3_9MICO|nr:ABC transporter substrate-binding protein [Subtercola frigoramans]MBM7473463.1 iron(III) transport system substrate-binding protein [Subtercola frigoramans]